MGLINIKLEIISSYIRENLDASIPPIECAISCVEEIFNESNSFLVFKARVSNVY